MAVFQRVKRVRSLSNFFLSARLHGFFEIGQLLWFWFYYDLRLTECSNWQVIGFVWGLRHLLKTCALCDTLKKSRGKNLIIVPL